MTFGFREPYQVLGKLCLHEPILQGVRANRYCQWMPKWSKIRVGSRWTLLLVWREQYMAKPSRVSTPRPHFAQQQEY